MSCCERRTVYSGACVNNHKCIALGRMFGRAESKRLGPGGLSVVRPGLIAKQERVVYSIQEVMSLKQLANLLSLNDLR